MKSTFKFGEIPVQTPSPKSFRATSQWSYCLWEHQKICQWKEVFGRVAFQWVGGNSLLQVGSRTGHLWSQSSQMTALTLLLPWWKTLKGSSFPNPKGPSLVAQTVNNPPIMQETWVQSLGWADPLEKGMATHFSILAWRISWTEELGRLQSMGLQRVGHDWATNTFHFHVHWVSDTVKPFHPLLPSSPALNLSQEREI